MTDQLLLIDLSSLAHPIWHMSGKEPDPNHVSTQVVARVRALASAHPHAAVCCDAGKSFRCDIDPSYKANRPESLAPLQHQITLAAEALKSDGFPVWRVPGFEADDLIASAAHQCLLIPDTTVLIASADKDLLQLVNDRVTAKSLTNGAILDEAAVIEKFKVRPDQMLDYLSLVGDVSDNVKGAAGIGGVRAAALLKEFDSLDGVYMAIDAGATPTITPAQRTSLQEFRWRRATVRALIALRSDVEIPFAEVAAERVPVEVAMDAALNDNGENGESAQYFYDAQRTSQMAPERELTQEQATDALGDAARKVSERIQPSEIEQRILDAATAGAVAGRAAERMRFEPRTELVASAPVSWDQQLEPRTMQDAITLAKHMHDSRLFSAYGTAQAVLSTILAGRELGMPAMASLRAFHIIEGKPQLSADSIAALVLKSGKAKYFKPVERSATAATFRTLRIGEDEEPFTFIYTLEEARQAWKRDQKAWDASGWGKNPADMLVARCKAKLARLVYPDVVAGLYDPSEVE